MFKEVVDKSKNHVYNYAPCFLFICSCDSVAQAATVIAGFSYTNKWCELSSHSRSMFVLYTIIMSEGWRGRSLADIEDERLIHQ